MSSYTKGEHQTVPLSVLLKRELSNEKIENPEIFHGQANHSKKGEDFTLVKTECQRVLGDDVTTYHVFGVCFGSYFLFARLFLVWMLIAWSYSCLKVLHILL